MKKKLAIIGGSYLQLPLVNKAKDMGIETHCFAWSEGAVCKEYADFFYPISIVEKEEILKICRDVKIDAITTIASDLAVLTVTYVAEELGLIANQHKYAISMTNKYEMRNCFYDSGIPSPTYFKANETTYFADKALSFPLIVKPTDRSGSLGVQKVDNIEDLNKAILRACESSFTKEAIIEQYIDGREISVESISFKGEHTILQMTDKVTTGAPYFVELEHHQPSTLPEEIKKRVRTIVTKALDALHIEYGASHSELKITDDGKIYVIEIGGRMGGDFIGSDLVMLSTGYDYLKGVIMCSLGVWEEPVVSLNNHAGVYFLCKETENIMSYIKDFQKYPEIVKAEITDNTLRNIQCSGDRSGYYIYNKCF